MTFGLIQGQTWISHHWPWIWPYHGCGHGCVSCSGRLATAWDHFGTCADLIAGRYRYPVTVAFLENRQGGGTIPRGRTLLPWGRPVRRAPPIPNVQQCDFRRNLRAFWPAFCQFCQISTVFWPKRGSNVIQFEFWDKIWNSCQGASLRPENEREGKTSFFGFW